jgi:hypothetical protein
MTMRVSLAELAAADIRLHPAEAVALVSSLCRRQQDGELRGVPSPGIIRLTRDGDVVVEGPVTTGEGEVARMAQLLSDLLPGFDAAPEVRPSGGLRLVIARALGTLDLPAYGSIDDFRAALDRFAAPDLRASVRCVFRAWEEKKRGLASAAGRLTISDVRRARRATGLTLEDIASVADVPAPLLRELEWGYLRNWPPGDEGRDRIVRYARAAGLDEVIVFSIAWPLVEDAAGVVEQQEVTVNGLVPVVSQAVAIPAAPGPAPAAPPSHHWVPWVVAVAGIAVLTLATITTTREQPQRIAPVAAGGADRIEQHVAPVSIAVAEREPAPEPPRAAAASAAPPVPARARRPAVRPAARPAPATRRPAPRPEPKRSKSFLHKELFRIVFR